LAQPDNQELGERADAYNRLIKDMAVLPVAAAPAQGCTGAGYALTLDGEWKQGRLDRFGHTLGFAPERYIVPGMSGSPIVSAAGAAIGVISTGSEGSIAVLQPVLLDCLPAWLARVHERENRQRRRIAARQRQR